MNIKQKLYPQKIYQVNRAIDEFKEVCELDKQLIGFCALNYYNRKFNWYVVHKDRWIFDENIINNIKKCCRCKEHKSKWESFLKVLNDLNNEDLKESIEYFNKIINDTPGISESLEEFHFHFLNTYQSYPIDSDIYFDGIVYRNFRRKKKKLLYATGETLSNLECTYNLYPWLDITLCFEDDEKITSFSCQECGEDEYDIKYESLKKENQLGKLNKPQSFKHSDVDKLYFYYLLPIIAGYNHPDPNKELYDGMYGHEKYLLEPSHIAPYKYILFIPVYDVPIGKKLYGNFFGNITIPLNKELISENKRDVFIKNTVTVIEQNLFLLKK